MTSPASPYRATPYGLFDKFLFGKYYGKTVLDIISYDPDYLAWVLDTIDGIELTEKAEMALDEKRLSNSLPF